MKKIAILLLLLFVAGMAFANSAPAFRKGAAELGIGGATSLYGYNSSAVIYNPALLNRAKFRLDVLKIGIAADDEFIKLVQFIKDHQEEFSRFDSLSYEEQQVFLKDMEQFDDRWYSVNLTPMFGLTFKHYGLAVSSQTYPAIKLDRGIMIPAVGLSGYSDLTFYAGYGNEHEWKILGKPRLIEYGATLKIINRRELPEKRIPATQISSESDVMKEVQDDLKKKRSGVGIDAGFAHKLNETTEAALVIHDLLTSYDGKIMTPNVVIGTKYSLKDKLIPNAKAINRWIAVAEIEDFFNGQGTAFFYKWHLGTEWTLWNRLLLRGGFNQGYPGYGVGLDLYVLKLDYTYYGEELGTKPGQLESYKHFLQLSLGW